MPVMLASNERTTKKARIKRASQRARSLIKKLDKNTAGDLRNIYQITRDQLQADILSFAGNDGLISLEVMRDVVLQIDRIMDQLASQRDNLLGTALGEGARIGSNVFDSVLSSNQLFGINEEAVRFVQHFVAEDGLQLSARLWRNTEHMKTNVKLAVQSAIIRGRSASQATQDFISRGETIPPDLARNIKQASAFNVAKIAGQELMATNNNPYYQAKRIFRTEINRAHGVAYESASFEDPDVVGMKFLLSPNHPRVDICDMHASANIYGLGEGVYPRGKSPWMAHPNTLSFHVVVYRDEVTDQDREGKQNRIDWLQTQPPHVQSGVVGGRKKYAALKQGLLKEGEISTPWNVLKLKYQRKGIDVDGLSVTVEPLKVKPGQGLGPADVRIESRNYVRQKGLNTGWEHAHIFDVKTGDVYIQKTSRAVNFVEFDSRELAVMQNKKNRLELTHNHPSSSSLSLADLRVGTMPGVERVVAVGHDGGVFSARSIDTVHDITYAHDIADRKIRQLLNGLIREKKYRPESANYLHGHLLNSSLDRAGFIDYEAEVISEFMQSAVDDIPYDFDELVQLIANAIS